MTTSAGSPPGLPPGPNLPDAVQAMLYLRGQPGFFAACRGRFGPTWTMRLPGLGPLVVTGDREAIRRLFTGDPLLRRHGNDLLRSALGERSMTQLEPAEHLARRRTVAPLFHGESIRRTTERMRELIETEVAGWPSAQVVAVHPRARALTLTIILELVLGIEDDELAAAFAAIFSDATDPEPAPAAAMERLRSRLDAYIAGVAPADRSGLLALLGNSRDQDGHGLTDADLRDEVVTLVSAGQSVATAIAWACDLLAHHPAVVRRLRETLADRRRDYLEATVREVLRVRPVTDVTGARRMLEPLPIGPWLVPPGVYLLVDAQGVHEDPRLYPEPDRFHPARFLEPPDDGYAHIPFGGGAHRCVGAGLATTQLEMFTAAFVSCFDPSPVGPPARPVRRGLTLAPADGAQVRLDAVTPGR